MERALPCSPPRWLLGAAFVVTLALSTPGLSGQQRAVTLDEAIASALQGGPRAEAAAADSAAAAARVATAREFPNPALALDWTKDLPHNHVVLEQPLEYPWVRSARIGSARNEAAAATLRAEIARARIRYDVIAAYVEAASARGILALSRQDVADGDELVRVAVARRDAGDASDLDVALAQVNAAQLHSTLVTDSIAFLAATLRLQSEIGLPVDSLRVTPVDTVIAAAPIAPPRLLEVTASEAAARAAASALSAAQRSRIPAPAVRLGFDQGDPEGDNGILPVVGVSIDLPIWSRNGGAVAEARAQARRAQADLAIARREADLAFEQGARVRALAAARLEQDRLAVAAAQQVARGSLTAYTEGAYPLSSVLEAQRSAREALRRYLEDLAAAQTADAAFTLAGIAGVTP